MEVQFRLKNFKAFSDTRSLNMAPVTILCGSNSSGKSSILKSILLLKQSSIDLRSRLIGGTPVQPLLFNGALTQLGSWTDVAHGKIRDTHIGFEWNISGETDRHSSQVTAWRSQGIAQRVFFYAPPQKTKYAYDISITLNSYGENPVELATGVEEISIIDKNNCYEILLKRDLSLGQNIYIPTVKNLSNFLGNDAKNYEYIKDFPSQLIKELSSHPNLDLTFGGVSIDFIGPFPAGIPFLMYFTGRVR